MNIILEGPDATGKSTLANSLKEKYHMDKIIHCGADGKNDYNYFIDLLNNNENTIFDRFHIGEMVYPVIYGRDFKLTEEDFRKINNRIIEKNAIVIIFYSSDIDLLKERLVERDEYHYLKEIDQQNKEYLKRMYILNVYEDMNLKFVDVANENAYSDLDKWIEIRLKE